MDAQHKFFHAGVMIVGDIPKLVGLVGVAMVLFLRIDLCTYIFELTKWSSSLTRSRWAFIRTRLRLYGKGQHVGIFNTLDQQTPDIPTVVG